MNLDPNQVVCQSTQRSAGPPLHRHTWGTAAASVSLLCCACSSLRSIGNGHGSQTHPCTHTHVCMGHVHANVPTRLRISPGSGADRVFGLTRGLHTEP